MRSSLILLALASDVAPWHRCAAQPDGGCQQGKSAVAEAGRRRPGGGFRLRRARAHAHGSRGGGRRHSPSSADQRRAGGGSVPARRRGRSSEALKSEQILVDPVVKVTVVGISQPSDLGDGRGEKAADVPGRGRGDAAGRAGAGRRAGSGCRHGSSGEPPAAVSGFARRSAATLVERIPVNRLLKDADPAVNYRVARRRGDPGPGSRQDFRAGQCEEAGRVSGARRGRKFGAETGGAHRRPAAVRVQAGLHLPRATPPATKQEIPVELDKIMQRKAPDVPLAGRTIFFTFPTTRRGATR